MKRLLCLILCMLMVFTLFSGCGGEESAVSEGSAPAEVALKLLNPFRCRTNP